MNRQEDKGRSDLLYETILELKDLDAAMLAALKQTNDFVLSQGKPLDPMSKAAYEDILAHSAQNGENA